MRVNKNFLVPAAAVVCCIIVVWFSTSIQGVSKTYEVEPEITLPEYRTDAARAIDAYERLMERYMDLTERNLFMVAVDVKDVTKKLDSIDHKLTELCARIAGIEKALDIEQPNQPAEKEAQTESLDIKGHQKSSCSATD
jgi:hypothetical protein